MAEESGRSSLITDDSSTENFVGRLLCVQQYDNSRIESNKRDADSGRVVTVGGEVDSEETGNSADGDDRTKLVCESEGKEIKLVKASPKSPQQPIKLNLCFDPPRRAVNLARAASYDCRSVAACCRYMMKSTRYVLNICEERVHEAIERAVLAEEFDKATLYRALANKYDIAIKLATTNSNHIDAAAESAENASMEAEIAANQMIAALNETSDDVEEKLSNVYYAANGAKMAASVAYEIEYAAMKVMKKCLKDIDPNSLEIEAISSPSEERAFSRNTQEMVVICSFSTASFIFGILIFALILSLVKGEDNPNTFISLIAVGSILIVIPVVYILYKIFMYYTNKRRDARQRINRHITTRIDRRLQELEEYFESNDITPIPSESEDEVQ